MKDLHIRGDTIKSILLTLASFILIVIAELIDGRPFSLINIPCNLLIMFAGMCIWRAL